ncbi:phage tail protein [Escherichia coli]|uniref:Phage tail protein n=2 Tax=Escherichia coli TaxID=562 RepID=A0AB73REQ1_ECOLX|nr:phage tail protein [Escherichia coli]MBL9237228.1 phage tail protein [Escherichia coli]MBL9237270.1 phage tail protein [Escherichia coli]OZO65096.1 phage tail protein [Escherichia coli]OZO75175.1 phage tail protein [Escherichia coli]OZP04546.1 phage tail protein [Escherichia coli]
MATKYYALLTNVGAAKLANATALGEQVEITQMAVGDGNGALPTPNPAQTALVHELRRAPLNTLTIDPVNTNQIIAEQVIQEDVGGWWIREIGLYDSDGDMIAVANCAETYKPLLQEGSGRMQVIRVILIVSSTQAVTLKIDPSVVLATRQYVDDQIIQVKAFVDQQLAAHIAAADPHKQYAPKASPALTGTPTAPTATAGNNSTQLANTAFVQAALVAVIGGAPTTLDTLKEIATAINNDPNFSATINNALALKAPLASPAMTGTPTAPTAAQTVNNTQIATTEFVKSAIAALVASSPAALDTLNELAAALGNDPNFATTVTNALAGKQPLDSTLTDLSGKTVNGILQYLGLGDASGYVGRLLNIQVFTASGTVTKTPGAKKWRIKCLGAGGGSSAAPATGSNEVSVGSGGGAGAYAEGIYDVSSITTASVVIGSGGAGGTAGSIYGADGGTSSVGSFISSPGGRAGLPAGPANPPFQPVANNNSDGPTGWNIVGSSGAGAEPAVAVAYSYAAGSRGSNSIFGVGGSVPALNSPANPGGGYGSGASGCSNGPSQSAKSGAAGRPGIVIIEELA